MLTQEGCPHNMLAIKDALETMDGKWKFLILIALSSGSKRFKEISKAVNGISDKMLSKELKMLEINKLVKREALDAFAPTAEYSITEHGRSLERIMKELYAWGVEHRRQVTGK